ncbi:hypothetical protein FHX40_3311 [Thermopolyspora flexuosa]|uniref:Uncharacterized protein n=1 Tax=Thermopolyspora flexuosa TaxID=103836 RepID=A0A543J171_9ACTN|nr:hypothetical protein FHX40_3311 [Thermopolyspora flexuosa]
MTTVDCVFWIRHFMAMFRDHISAGLERSPRDSRDGLEAPNRGESVSWDWSMEYSRR